MLIQIPLKFLNLMIKQIMEIFIPLIIINNHVLKLKIFIIPVIL